VSLQAECPEGDALQVCVSAHVTMRFGGYRKQHLQPSSVQKLSNPLDHTFARRQRVIRPGGVGARGVRLAIRPLP
jgi:hypothetical protein